MKEILKGIEQVTELLEQRANMDSEKKIMMAATNKLDKLNLLLAPYKTILNELPHRGNSYNVIRFEIGKKVYGFHCYLFMSDAPQYSKYNFYIQYRDFKYTPRVSNMGIVDALDVRKFCIDHTFVQDLNADEIICKVKQCILKHIDVLCIDLENQIAKNLKALEAFDIQIDIGRSFDNLLDLLIETNEQFKTTHNEQCVSIISSIIDNIKEIRKEVN